MVDGWNKEQTNQTGILSRNKINNPKICLEPKKTTNNKSNLERKEQNQRYHTFGYQMMQQKYITRKGIVLAQK